LTEKSFSAFNGRIALRLCQSKMRRIDLKIVTLPIQRFMFFLHCIFFLIGCDLRSDLFLTGSKDFVLNSQGSFCTIEVHNKGIKKLYWNTISNNTKISISPNSSLLKSGEKVLVNIVVSDFSSDFESEVIFQNIDDASDNEKVIIKFSSNSGETQISDNTFILSDSTNQKLSSSSDDGNTFLFDDNPKEIESLSPGNIIVIGMTPHTPFGALKKVTGLYKGDEYFAIMQHRSSVGIYATNPNQVVIETESASLEDIIEGGEIILKKNLVPDNIGSATALKNGVFLKALESQIQTDFAIQLEHVILYDLDGVEGTKYDQITADGIISFTIGFDFNVEIKSFKIKSLYFSNNIKNKTEIIISSNTEIYGLNKEVEIAHYTFGVITFMVGLVPVYITPELIVSVGVDGHVSFRLSQEVDQEATLLAGLSYKDGNWTPIGDFKVDFGFDTPSYSSEALFKAYSGLGLNLMLYGVVGPYANVNGYFELSIEPTFVELDAGLFSDIGVFVKALGHTFADYNQEVIDYKKILLKNIISSTSSTITSTSTTIASFSSSSSSSLSSSSSTSAIIPHSTTTSLPFSDSPEFPWYSQRDPQWSDDYMGIGNYKMGTEGCAVTCVAMLYQAQTNGDQGSTPSDLNIWLKNNGGYTYQDGHALINWDIADDMDGKGTGIELVSSNSTWNNWNYLDSQLAAGRKVIVKVDFTPNTADIVDHWVLVYKKDGTSGDPNSYFINDPWPLSYVNRTLQYYYDQTYKNTFFSSKTFQGSAGLSSTSTAVGSTTTTAFAPLSITGISPGSATKGTNVTFTLTGTGFQNGFTAQIINELGTAYDISQREFINSNQVRVTVYLGSGPTSTQYIKIINPNDQNAQINFTALGNLTTSSSSTTTTAIVTTTTAAVPISITDINPSTATKGTTVTFTLTGTGFQNGFTAQIINELGTAYDISQREFINSNQVRVTVYLGSGPTSTQYIKIINPNGQNAQINFTALSNLTSSSSTTTTAIVTTTAAVPLSITNISPSTATKGTTVTFTLTGTGFQNGFTAQIINELGTAYDIAQREFISSTQVRVTVYLGSGPTSTQYIKIINPNGQNAQINFTALGNVTTSTSSTTTTAPSQTLPDLSISANVGSSYTAGQTGVQIPVTVTRTGVNLTNGTYVLARLYWSANSIWDSGDTQLWESNGSTPDFPISYLNTYGSKTVTATLSIPAGAPGGSYIIAVVDPTSYHSESNENNNSSSYTVTVYSPTTSSIFTTTTASSSTSTTVKPAPVISSISPASRSYPAGAFDLTIYGSNFDNAVDMVYTPSGQYMGSAAVIRSRSATQLVAAEDMGNTAPGTYTVRVKNSDGQLSNSVNLVITAATTTSAIPSISSISPSTSNATTFDLTIYGSNFDSGAVDQIYWKADGHFVGQGSVLSRSSSQLVVRQFMTGATLGTYVVKIKNSNGTESNGKDLQIQ